MTRPEGRTWKSYSRLVEAAGKRYGGTLVLNDDAQPQEEEWMAQLSAELRPSCPQRQEAQDLLAGLEIGLNQFRCHLRYIARWGHERRRLLGSGANFQLLEGLAQEEENGLLAGLQLSGKLHEQRRLLSGHLKDQQDLPIGQGWLTPAPSSSRKVRVFDNRQLVWVYPSDEVDFLEGLHPFVARSLIARYVPTPGIVADPMAGDGVVAQMAVKLGHIAWASDIEPSQPYIKQLDLLETDLGKVFGEDHLKAADLLVLHPPLPETLGLSLALYTDWLKDILKKCWGAVKAEGHLAVIVPVSATVPVLARAERALRDSASVVFREDVEELTASHLAASRNGQEGWHILVWQTPPIDEAREAD